MRLAEAMTKFYLGFAHGEAIARDPRAQKAAQNFFTLQNDFGKLSSDNLETIISHLI